MSLLALSAFVAAAVLLQLKTLLDNTDGGLARLTGRVTLLGRYLDSEADTALNAFLFAVLGVVTDRPWLALAAFCALTIVLSVDFNLTEVYREVRGEEARVPPRSGGGIERALALVYDTFFAPQDRLIRALSARRLERVLRGVGDPAERRSRDARLPRSRHACRAGEPRPLDAAVRARRLSRARSTRALSLAGAREPGAASPAAAPTRAGRALYAAPRSVTR